jgi:cell shape-determining protein MreD
LAFGIVYDLYFFLPPGFHVAGFIISLLVAHVFLANVFTNRSLYSFLALSFLAVFSYLACVYALAYGLQFVTGQTMLEFSLDNLLSELAGLGADLAITAVLFYIYSAVSRRLKPVFIKT